MDDGSAPEIALSHLDDLWFQVAGTLCNLACEHCFISCTPHNDSFGMLSRAEIENRLEESVALGVKEYYFTGGEPFLHRELVDILITTLRYGPATVLTNATVLRDEWLVRLARAEAESPYSLEFRVSLDGFSPETNDPIRGAGAFARAMHGVRRLVAHGFLPIITAARTWDERDDEAIVGQFLAVLRAAGYDRPRLKILPALRLGAEETRTRGYAADERVTREMLREFDRRALACDHSRVVSVRGVHVCPILIEADDALLGRSLAESRRSFALAHGACSTCYQHGALCANPSSGRAAVGRPRDDDPRFPKERS